MNFENILKHFFDIGFKQNVFEKRCGLSNGKISEIYRGRVLLSDALITQMVVCMQEIIIEIEDTIEQLEESRENVDNNYLVYEFTFPDGEKYYGRTYNTDARWKNGRGYKTQKVGKAIEECGWENVQKKIIAENLTKENAQMIEHSLIKATGSDIPGFGYNIY